MGSICEISLITAFTLSFTASYEVLNRLKKVRKFTVSMKQYFPAPLVDIRK